MRTGWLKTLLVSLLLTRASLPAWSLDDPELSGESSLAQEIVITGRRRPPQAAEQNLSAREAASVPGSGQDVVRAVAALPGVQVANDYLANLMVRGSGLNDNLILLDGFPASYPFHFGGLESVFPSSLLSSASLLSSGFDARYGDRQGAVLELSTGAPPEGLHAGASASEILLGAQARLGRPSYSVQGSVRRGFFDLVVPPREDLTEVPRYQDYLAQARLRLENRSELMFMAFGSQDSTRFTDPDDASQSFGWESGFHTAGARLVWQPWPGWTLVSLGSATLSRTKILLSGKHFDQQPYEWFLHQEAGWVPNPGHDLNFGLEWHQTRTWLDADFNRIPTELGSGFNYDASPPVRVLALGSKSVLSGWAQDRWQVLPLFWVNLGGRYDQVDLTQESFFSPRLSAEWQFDPRTTWRASLGDYFQSLQPLETVPGWSPLPLHSDLTRTWTLGLEKKPLPGQTASLEYYHKDFNRFILTQVVDVNGDTVSVNSVPTGHTDGVEAVWRVQPRGDFFGWISYAYAFTEKTPLIFTEGNAEADFDQPHVFNLVASWQPVPAWEIGLRQKVASGIPYTPVRGRSFDGANNKWIPVFGPVNSERLDWYHRLDLRAQYTFKLKAWTLKVFGEVLNVYDRANVTSVAYRDDYSGLQEVKQFPRIYFVGIEGEI